MTAIEHNGTGVPDCETYQSNRDEDQSAETKTNVRRNDSSLILYNFQKQRHNEPAPTSSPPTKPI